MPIFISVHKKILVLFATIILILVSIWIFVKYQSLQKESVSIPILTSTPQSPMVSVSTTTESATTLLGMKTYRNKEWGFEFQYPEDLILDENAFYNYYSKFNLRLLVKMGEKFDYALSANIVLPQFIKGSFGGLEKTATKVIVDGVSGVKYQYNLNDRKETTVVLPLNEYNLLLGTYYEEYEDLLNQILSTFKFIK